MQFLKKIVVLVFLILHIGCTSPLVEDVKKAIDDNIDNKSNLNNKSGYYQINVLLPEEYDFANGNDIEGCIIVSSSRDGVIKDSINVDINEDELSIIFSELTEGDWDFEFALDSELSDYLELPFEEVGGKVLFATINQMDVPLSLKKVTPPSISYESSFLSITTFTSDVEIYYTYSTDGEAPVPTKDSNVYSTPFSLPNGEINIKAIAYKDGFLVSDIATEFIITSGPNAYLKDIELSNGSISPVFSKSIYSYRVSVENSVSSLNITPETDDADATYQIKKGSTVITNPVALSVGSNLINIRVTADDGTTFKLYNLDINRAAEGVSNDASLKSLSVAQGSLSPSFSSTNLAYVLAIGQDIADIDISSETNHSEASISYYKNGSKVTDHISALDGDEVSVKVTAEDGVTVKNYTITVNRALTADLDALSISLTSLDPSFAPGVTAYTSSVASDTESVIVTASAVDTNASLTINGDQSPATITLVDGNNNVKVRVTSADSQIVKDYDIVIYKPEEVNGITIHTKGHDYTHIWAWEGDRDLFTSWPGEFLEEEADGWFGYSFPDEDSIGVILSKSNGNDKTGDLDVTTGEWWYYNGELVEYNPDDIENPVVEITVPGSGETLTGTVSLQVNAADNVGVDMVKFYFNDTQIGVSEVAPFTLVWNSAYAPSMTADIKAVAYDKAGLTAEDTVSVTTSNANVLPVSDPGNDRIGYNGYPVVMSGSDSYDPNGTIVSYSWNFGDGNNGSGETVDHIYASNGTYTVRLIVTDNDGATDEGTFSITVKDKPDFEHRDFRNETVYFMMTDRFADGNTSNNNIWGDEYLPNGESQKYDYDESKTGILSYYHGGDFAGIIDNLDYIKEMGFTAIWITPVVKQSEGRYYYLDGDEPYQGSAFHGYWGYDFDQIDPHLHDSGKDNDGWSDFGNLVDAIHAKDMRLMLDIVINHGQNAVATAPTKWADYSDTLIVDGQTWKIGEGNDPYYSEVISTDPWTQNGFFSYTDSYSLLGLIDFNHFGEDGQDSRYHLINVYKKFIDYGVDAFRIDTAAYVPSAYMGEFADAMYNHAVTLGNEHFYMVTEGWCGRYDAIDRAKHDTTGSLHMIDMQASALDFPGQMQTVFKSGGDYSNFSNVINSDETMGLTEASKVGMFVDNHDCYRNNGVYSETEYKNALNYIYLFRGVPMVYYGTEAMYSWSGAHASTNKEDIVARWMLGSVGIDYVKNNQPGMYKHLKMLNYVYTNSKGLKFGEQEDLVMSGDQAVFIREGSGTLAYVAVSKGASFEYTFDNVTSGSYKVFIGSEGQSLQETTESISGSHAVTVPANGFVVIDKI